jgi:hypothetical protein
MELRTVGSKSHREHIPPHRVWLYLYVDGEFSAIEYDHLLTCPSCLRLFILCLQSHSFGHVLRELSEEIAGRQAA